MIKLSLGRLLVMCFKSLSPSPIWWDSNLALNSVSKTLSTPQIAGEQAHGCCYYKALWNMIQSNLIGKEWPLQPQYPSSSPGSITYNPRDLRRVTKSLSFCFVVCQQHYVKTFLHRTTYEIRASSPYINWKSLHQCLKAISTQLLNRQREL